MQPIIEVNNLRKSFKEKEVIHGIDFMVRQGEILCFLGPNGAGKSTTIHIMTGALRQTAGSVASQGMDITKNLLAFKKRLGIVPQDLALYEDLSAEQNVRFFASLYGLNGKKLYEASKSALVFTGLLDRAKNKVNTFSGGMKRRLNIACAIAHQPELLIMDEPTVGIDPQSRKHILDGVRNLRDGGMTILYTTHYMEEVEEIATRIIIMDEGNIIAEGANEALKAGIDQERRYVIRINGALPNTEMLTQVEGVKAVAVQEDRLEITTDKTVENLSEIISRLTAVSIKIDDISCQSASLETVFLQLTGKSLRD